MKGRRAFGCWVALNLFLCLRATAAPPAIRYFGPQDIYVGQHKTYTIRVFAYGRALEYQWWHQEPDAARGHAIPDGEGFPVNRPRLSVPDAADNRDYNGRYWCVIRNRATGETTTSPVANVTVVSPPVIRSHPRDQTVDRGGTATFNVVADAGAPVPLKYQWFRDGRPILNARQPTLTLNNVQARRAGLYSCRVTSVGGVTMSGGGLLKLAQ